jgi:hypothetical protein
MIFKYFRQKIPKNWCLWLKTKLNYAKHFGVWEKRQFFAENWQKSHKIVIITSTPDLPGLVRRFTLTRRREFVSWVPSWTSSRRTKIRPAFPSSTSMSMTRVCMYIWVSYIGTKNKFPNKSSASRLKNFIKQVCNKCCVKGCLKSGITNYVNGTFNNNQLCRTTKFWNISKFKMVLSIAYCKQGDQMRLWKSRPKCSPIYFCESYYIAFTMEKVAQLFGLL